MRRKTKINIDLRYSNGTGGISNYIRNIASLLADNEERDYQGCTFWYRYYQRNQYKWFKGKLRSSILPERLVDSTRILSYLSYEQSMCHHADLNVFFTYRLPYLRFRAPVIATIHDLILLKTNCEPQSMIDKHRRILENTVEKSAYLFTVSKASKQDLVDYFGYDANKIFVIHNGINQESFKKELTPEIESILKRKYGLPNHFILNFGAYRFHKNIERLIEAYALLDTSLRKKYKLVLTKEHPNLVRQIEKYNLQDDVRFIGFVSEGDKPFILKMASIVYYASLYEGFGVPIIESQAAGTPVITSIVSSLPEAAGNAAALVDPYNADDICHAIERILEDDVYTKKIITDGFVNSYCYTWERSVDEFVRALAHIGY